MHFYIGTRGAGVYPGALVMLMFCKGYPRRYGSSNDLCKSRWGWECHVVKPWSHLTVTHVVGRSGG